MHKALKPHSETSSMQYLEGFRSLEVARQSETANRKSTRARERNVLISYLEMVRQQNNTADPEVSLRSLPLILRKILILINNL